MKCARYGFLITIVLISGATAQTSSQSVPGNSSSQMPSIAVPEHPATLDQIREFARLSGTAEVLRTKWMSALDADRSKGEPYWPDSFWTDLKEEMRRTDLVPIIASVYQRHVSVETMSSVNASLHFQTVSQFAMTPDGARFCKLQQSMDDEAQAAILALTSETFNRVYQRDRTQIKAARAQYQATHPGWTDSN